MSYRGITDDERALVQHVGLWGSAGYPVRKVGSRHWTWGPWRSVAGCPRVFPTKRAATASFENFVDVLIRELADEARR